MNGRATDIRNLGYAFVSALFIIYSFVPLIFISYFSALIFLHFFSFFLFFSLIPFSLFTASSFLLTILPFFYFLPEFIYVYPSLHFFVLLFIFQALCTVEEILSLLITVIWLSFRCKAGALREQYGTERTPLLRAGFEPDN